MFVDYWQHVHSLYRQKWKNIGFIEEILLQNIFLHLPCDKNQLKFITDVRNYLKVK